MNFFLHHQTLNRITLPPAPPQSHSLQPVLGFVALASDTNSTAPNVAAANENKNVSVCTIPNRVKIHPPITDPINPNTTSPIHPNPFPRAIFPASHPATNPTNIHHSNPCEHTTTKLRISYEVAPCCIPNPAIKLIFLSPYIQPNPSRAVSQQKNVSSRAQRRTCFSLFPGPHSERLREWQVFGSSSL